MKKGYLILIFVSLSAVVLLTNPFGFETIANRAVACALLMVSLWVSEALPMPVVALMPLVLFPVLGIANTEETALPYANPVIFLFMGGFMIGLAIQKWGLHRRIALKVVRVTGTKGHRIVLGFILATGFLSMWLSNTATTMMMYPIALSVVEVMEKGKENGHNKLAICLLLSIAYASNFGGMATLVGTPPNVAFAAFLQKQYGYNFSFAGWLAFALPVSILLMAALYYLLTRVLYPIPRQNDEAVSALIEKEWHALGPMGTNEKRVMFVFLLTAILWIMRTQINTASGLSIDDNVIAIFGALLLFIIPNNDKGANGYGLLHWSDTSKLAWGILLLFGGGITLANQLEKVGVIQKLGQAMANGAGENMFLLMLIISVGSIFISELLSNVAQVIVFAPVLCSMAEAMGHHPVMLAAPMVLAASAASMLPMGTPPNAIVFGSGRLQLRDMVRTGFLLNIIAALLITTFCYLVLPLIL
jgi:solute carrier family 13 (sodium-dependent dicarboxylate transporter), member 2/3/5